jgi:mono/diheme cytochrome c family protein
MKRPLMMLFALSTVALSACNSGPSPAERQAAVDAFATVQKVFQHPRCQNCHIPGDAPLQFDAGLPHQMGVVRGPTGHGAPGLPCSTCHGEANAPESYGPNAPPGAPHWGLPPPEHRMVTIGLSAPALCKMIQDKNENGGRDFAALLKHVSEDKLVLWGWKPGGTRAPVPVPHAEFVAKFKMWADAGGPCPAS